MSSRCLSISLALTLFALISLLAITQIQRQEAPGVILLTVESLRDDTISQQQTPRLFTAAMQSGLRFLEHQAVSRWTDSNIVSLLTGLSPFRTGMHGRRHSLDLQLDTPLEQLARLGFTSAGLQPFMAMDPYANLGITVIAESGDPLLWLARQKQQQASFFLWYHYVDTHQPLDGETKLAETLPATTRERLRLEASKTAIQHDTARIDPNPPAVNERQRQAVIDFDRWFGRFWDHFQKSGLHRSTILVVTTDHGEKHGEHGAVGHDSTPRAGHRQEEIARVPLLIWVPHRYRTMLPEVETIGPSSHLDLMPTLFGLLGIEPETELDGRDLFRSTDTNGSMETTRREGEAQR